MGLASRAWVMSVCSLGHVPQNKRVGGVEGASMLSRMTPFLRRRKAGGALLCPSPVAPVDLGGQRLATMCHTHAASLSWLALQDCLSCCFVLALVCGGWFLPRCVPGSFWGWLQPPCLGPCPVQRGCSLAPVCELSHITLAQPQGALCPLAVCPADLSRRRTAQPAAAAPCLSVCLKQSVL